MTTYRGSGDIVPLINFGRPGCSGEERNFFPLLGFGPWIIQTTGKSLYWLCYPSSRRKREESSLILSSCIKIFWRESANIRSQSLGQDLNLGPPQNVQWDKSMWHVCDSTETESHVYTRKYNQFVVNCTTATVSIQTEYQLSVFTCGLHTFSRFKAFPHWKMAPSNPCKNPGTASSNI